MVKKIKAYLKGCNPYLAASAAIVILSVVIICLILKGETAAEQENDTVSAETIIQNDVEESDADIAWEESDVKEQEIIMEPEGLAESSMTEESSESEDLEEETAKVTEQEPAMTPEPEIIKESGKEAEIVVTPVPEQVPEESAEESQTPAEENIPAEENVSEPEPEPTPEATLEPVPTPTPEPEPAPAPIPTPESIPTETPEPDTHEHSWIFESFYQEPTCSNGGLVTQICAHCGETQVTGGTPTGEHHYEVETVGDCCSAEVVVCTECNHREVREKDPANHIDVEDGICYGCGAKTG